MITWEVTTIAVTTSYCYKRPPNQVTPSRILWLITGNWTMRRSSFFPQNLGILDDFGRKSSCLAWLSEQIQVNRLQPRCLRTTYLHKRSNLPPPVNNVLNGIYLYMHVYIYIHVYQHRLLETRNPSTISKHGRANVRVAAYYLNIFTIWLFNVAMENHHYR